MYKEKDFKNLAKVAKKALQYETDKKITWCGNCGNYSIRNAIMRALALEKMERNDFVICYDVGCSGNGSDKFEANTIHGLHGRVLPLAAGASIANKEMTIIAHAGDGATFSEGLNHLVHAIRNNYKILFVFHNNENYGLTTGQASSLTRKTVKMNSSPEGVQSEPLKAMRFALNLEPSLALRAYSGDTDHLTDMVRLGLKNDGFTFLEILQACPTYNRATPDHWFAERVKPIEDLENYDCTDMWQALKIADDLEKDIYLGKIYENPKRLSFLKSQSGEIKEVSQTKISDLL